jgi:class 3 adenylate cyclase
MPLVLLADVRGVATEDPEGAAPAGSPGPAESILDQVAKVHGGVQAQTTGRGRLVFFAETGDAVVCALAMQSRLAEHNRKTGEAGRVLMRIVIHAVADSGSAYALCLSERESLVASRILQATPAGRIFLSREAHIRCRSAAACVFIPLGTEYFSGLPDPLDLYEAWRRPQRGNIDNQGE